jgi:hypothetical protein
MIFWIGFILGTLAGTWATSWKLNHYYRSDVWDARKAVLLEQLLLQRKRYEVQRTKAELEIDRILRERVDS